MKTRAKVAGMLLGGLVLFGLGFGVGMNFVLENWRDNAFRDISRWGGRLVRSGSTGGGPTCTNATHNEILDVARSVAAPGVTVFPEDARNMNFEIDHQQSRNCFLNAQNKLLAYDRELDVVFGVWRCDQDGILGEFQVAIYRNPPPVFGTDHFCTYAMFKKELNIPLGAATRFQTP